MHKDFQKFNPYRQPDWRFNRVLELLDSRQSRRVSWRRDDNYVRHARTFIGNYRRYSEEQRNSLFVEAPGLYYAYLINENPDEELKYIIQARLLAGQTNEEIAAGASTLPSTIEWFEAVFFNVRDRLANRDWIVKSVMGPAADRGIADRTFDLTAKLFGYFGGPLMLDVILSGFGTIDRITDPTEVVTAFDKQMTLAIKRKSAMAALTFEVNKFNVMQVFEIHTRLIELEHSFEGGTHARTDFERNVNDLLSEMPFNVGSAATQALEGSPLLEYDTLAAEPRANELMQITTGRAGKLKDHLKDQKLPPPRKVPDEKTQQGS